MGSAYDWTDYEDDLAREAELGGGPMDDHDTKPLTSRLRDLSRTFRPGGSTEITLLVAADEIDRLRAALAARPQRDELWVIVTDLANLPYNYRSDTTRRQVDLLVGRARAALAGSAAPTGDDDE